MRKSNPKAAVICITFVIIALAAGIFIGYMMGQNSQPSQQGETVLSTEDPSSSAASDSDSDTQAASDSESSESESQTQGTENQEVVVTVGDRTVGMDEVNYRLYSLRNYYIQVKRETLGEPDEGTYYIADLIGIDVYSDEGKFLGILEDIYNTGSNDIYVVREKNGKQILLPAINDVIKEINIKDKKILVHLINGL